jgi:hypothetical protein
MVSTDCLGQQVGGRCGDDADRCDLDRPFDQGLAGDLAFDIAEDDEGEDGDDAGDVEPGFIGRPWRRKEGGVNYVNDRSIDVTITG